MDKTERELKGVKMKDKSKEKEESQDRKPNSLRGECALLCVPLLGKGTQDLCVVPGGSQPRSPRVMDTLDLDPR